MKKFLLFSLMTLFCMTLFAEKVYRSDGTFFEVKRNEGVFAMKLDAASLKDAKNYKMQWRSGDEFIVIMRDIPAQFQPEAANRIIENIRAIRIPSLSSVTGP